MEPRLLAALALAACLPPHFVASLTVSPALSMLAGLATGIWSRSVAFMETHIEEWVAEDEAAFAAAQERAAERAAAVQAQRNAEAQAIKAAEMARRARIAEKKSAKKKRRGVGSHREPEPPEPSSPARSTRAGISSRSSMREGSPSPNSKRRYESTSQRASLRAAAAKPRHAELDGFIVEVLKSIPGAPGWPELTKLIESQSSLALKLPESPSVARWSMARKSVSTSDKPKPMSLAAIAAAALAAPAAALAAVPAPAPALALAANGDLRDAEMRRGR